MPVKTGSFLLDIRVRAKKDRLRNLDLLSLSFLSIGGIYLHSRASVSLRETHTCSPAVRPDVGEKPPNSKDTCWGSLMTVGGCKLACAASSFAAMASASDLLPLGYACEHGLSSQLML